MLNKPTEELINDELAVVLAICVHVVYGFVLVMRMVVSFSTVREAFMHLMRFLIYIQPHIILFCCGKWSFMCFVKSLCKISFSHCSELT